MNEVRSRPPWWLVVVLLVAAAGGGFGAGALTTAAFAPEEPAPPSPYAAGLPVLTPEEFDVCVRQVALHFQAGDPAMRAALARLGGDPRFESVRGRTREESYRQFQEVFADEPELLANVRPETVPASVLVMVRRPGTAQQAEAALRGEFPDAEVDVQQRCPPVTR